MVLPWRGSLVTRACGRRTRGPRCCRGLASEPKAWTSILARRYSSRGPYPEAAARESAQVIHVDPDILSGTPVFVGTRVPAQALFDDLEGGETLDAFLDQFPSVNRDLALAALELARDSLLAQARSA